MDFSDLGGQQVPDPQKKKIDFSDLGGSPVAGALPRPPASDFEVSRRAGAQVTDTLNVPPDREAEYGKTLKRQAKIGAAALPVAAALAAPPLLGALYPAAAAGAGTLAETALASGAGAAVGKLAEHGVNAAVGNPSPAPEMNPLESAAKTGLETAGVTAGAGAALNVGAKVLQNIGREALDFFGAARRGTAALAGGIKGPISTPTEAAVRSYGEEVAKAIDNQQKVVGGALNSEIAAMDKAIPGGVIPHEDLVEHLAQLKRALRATAPIPGAPAAAIKAAGSVEGMLDDWANNELAKVTETMQGGAMKHLPMELPAGAGVMESALPPRALPPVNVQTAPMRDKLSLQEGKDLLDQAREAIPYDDANPGAAKAAMMRLEPFSAWLRQKLGEVSPKLDAALQQYHQFIGDAQTIKDAVGVGGAGPITRDRISAIEVKLAGLLHARPAEAGATHSAFNAVGASALENEGRSLAVGGELAAAGEAPKDSGLLDFAGRLIRGITSPMVRPIFGPAAKLAEKTAVPIEQASKAGGLVGAITAARRKKDISNGE
jgi:hypothetical protein